MIDLCLEIAITAHKGQKDLDGNPGILDNYKMEEIKKEIEDLHKRELEVRVKLIKKIRKEYDSYHKKKVMISISDYDGSLAEEYYDLQYDVQFNPYYCKGDGDKYMITDAYLEATEAELRLYVQNWDFDIREGCYMVVDKPDFNDDDMTLNDMFGLLTLLKCPIIKELNRIYFTL